MNQGMESLGSDSPQRGEIVVSRIGDNPMDVALSAMAFQASQLDRDVEVQIMKTAMEVQETVVNDLLQSLGIGTYLDTYA
jgi:hypothetical protein